jgi:hypothetical protein
MAGVGRAQRWGGEIEEIRPGDVVWFAPDEKHWHGAAPAMMHIAIQEEVVDWMEKAGDKQYRARRFSLTLEKKRCKNANLETNWKSRPSASAVWD